MSKDNLIINIKINDNQLPFYATEQSAGMDICSNAEIILKKKERTLVPTGISISLPNGFEAQIRSRSGLAYKHGVYVLNAPGTIDADYRGEIFIIMANDSDTDFKIKKGMRIAQMVIAKYEKISWNVVDDLDNTKRQAGGFGSTGL